MIAGTFGRFGGFCRGREPRHARAHSAVSLRRRWGCTTGSAGSSTSKRWRGSSQPNLLPSGPGPVGAWFCQRRGDDSGGDWRAARRSARWLWVRGVAPVGGWGAGADRLASPMRLHVLQAAHREARERDRQGKTPRFHPLSEGPWVSQVRQVGELAGDGPNKTDRMFRRQDKQGTGRFGPLLASSSFLREWTAQSTNSGSLRGLSASQRSTGRWRQCPAARADRACLATWPSSAARLGERLRLDGHFEHQNRWNHCRRVVVSSRGRCAADGGSVRDARP